MFNGSASGISFTMPFGGSTIDGRSAFIDDKFYAAIESSSGALRQGSTPTQFQMYVVGNELVSATGFLPSGVSYCSCSASTWGYWGMDVIHSSGRDRIHLGQFVAGSVPVSVQTSGTANYVGHAIADIATNGGARYKAAGNFTFGYNFGTGSASWQVTSIDGGSLNGSITGGGSGSPTFSGGTFSGSTNGTGAISSGTFNGVFFTNGVDPSAEVGTNFQGFGMNGNIVGITQGRKQ